MPTATHTDVSNEKEHLLERLRTGRDRYLQIVSDVPEQLSRVRPGEGMWSVLECAEHVANAEVLMFEALAKRRHRDAPPDFARDARIEAVLLDRTRKMPAPEAVRPHDRFATLAQSATNFEAMRAETLTFVERCKEDLRKRTALHPLAVFDGCQLLRIMALHPLRQASQMEEIKASQPYRAALTKLDE
jgi:DinB superfamily